MSTRIEVTHPDRLMWPQAGTTKRDLVAYYEEIGPVLVPHIAGRPLMLGRWPEGMAGRGFGQFECRGHPAWMRAYPLRLRNGKTVEVCVVDDTAAVVWLANQGVIELHPYLWRVETPEIPIEIVFDLDPGAPAALAQCCVVALAIRERLVSRGLVPHVKTTGGGGLHVVAAVPSASFDDTKRVAREIAAELADVAPDRVTDRMPKRERAGRVFIDWSQNDPRKQTIAPYSLRANETPHVATPISWDEVASGATGAPLAFGPAEVLARVRERGDLFGA